MMSLTRLNLNPNRTEDSNDEQENEGPKKEETNKKKKEKVNKIVWRIRTADSEQK